MLSTINRPENEPLLNLKNINPAVDVKNAITIHARAAWVTSSHKTDVLLSATKLVYS